MCAGRDCRDRTTHGRYRFGAGGSADLRHQRGVAGWIGHSADCRRDKSNRSRRRYPRHPLSPACQCRKHRRCQPHQACDQSHPAKQPGGAGGRHRLRRAPRPGCNYFPRHRAHLRRLFPRDGQQGRKDADGGFCAAIAYRSDPERRRTDPQRGASAQAPAANDVGAGRTPACRDRAEGRRQRQRRDHRSDPPRPLPAWRINMIHCAIVGLGRWGRNLVEAARGGGRLKLTRAVETDIERARSFCTGHELDLTGDFDAVLSDKAVDAVLLATPHSLHLPQVIAAAAARKHVFCEKPLALRRDHAARTFDACRTAGVILAVGHNRRFWPSMRALRDIVGGGELGTILHIEGHNSNENSETITDGWRLSPEESPGGGLTGPGLHVLDAFVSLLGPARQVFARLNSRETGPPPRDSAVLSIDFANGFTGTLATVRATPFYWRVHVFGTKGSAEVLDEGTMVLRKSGGAPQVMKYHAIDTLAAELDAFADAVENRHPFPVRQDQVLATLAAFEAALSSMKTGQPVACDG